MFKVYQLKLKNDSPEYFNRLFLEAKWYCNHILSQESVFAFDTKVKIVDVLKAGIGSEPESRSIRNLSSQMRQELKKRICNSIKALSKIKSTGKRVGGLKYHKEVNSIPMNNQIFFIKGNRLRFQGNKHWFRVRGLDRLPQEYSIRSANLVRKPSGIYLHLCVRLEPQTKSESSEKSAIGLDMGIGNAFVFSDGTKVDFDGAEQLNKIKKAHKSLSRKKRLSQNWFKAKQRLNREYERMDNIKNDAANKLIAALSSYKVVFQDEMISNWQKGLFGKQVQNSILGRVKAKLRTNSANLMLDRSFPTTQTCRDCGRLNKHRLSERVYHCECSYSCDRDTHSALNMLWFAGLEQAAVETMLDFQRVLSSIQCKQLSVKREAPSFMAG